ncbi:MAG: ABC transporter ATP-binding protein [Mesorhizobium sp.]|uniref:ABC transporter ATP-binding protein n=1 Tax=Mesorhizobium sp. TaxID=1871066 RepID=UPI0012125165|nr:ATP-binding cassette domain-containing protein [Mesorhizobium sp.]TIR48682.1 MAG: ABC transporter ATP-binding protein [Mesorhizobium sp.]
MNLGSPISGRSSLNTNLIASNVTFAYGSGPAVVKNVSLTVPKGAAIGIVGESGSGKSTLASLLVGMLTPTTGSITIGGHPWSKIDRGNPMRRAVQMMFQNPYSALNPYLSALRTVAEVYQFCGGFAKAEAAERAQALLKRVGISGLTQLKRPSSLSGGQCQRVGIARALAATPSIIVADEPTSALDVSVQAQILNLLSDLRQEQGVGLVLISHDLNVVSYLTERAIVMERGEVVEEGVTSELLQKPGHPYTQRLIASIL